MRQFIIDYFYYVFTILCTKGIAYTILLQDYSNSCFTAKNHHLFWSHITW